MSELDPSLYAPEYIRKVNAGEICEKCGDLVEEGEPLGHPRTCDVCQMLGWDDLAKEEA